MAVDFCDFFCSHILLYVSKTRLPSFDFATSSTNMPHSGAANNLSDTEVMTDELIEMYSDFPNSISNHLRAIIEAADTEYSDDHGSVGTLELLDAESAPGPSDEIANFIAMFPAVPAHSQREDREIHMPEQMDPNSGDRNSISMMAPRPADHQLSRPEDRHSGNPGEVRQHYGFDSDKVLQGQSREESTQDDTQPEVMQEDTRPEVAQVVTQPKAKRISTLPESAQVWLGARKNSIIRHSSQAKKAVNRSIGSIKGIKGIMRNIKLRVKNFPSSV